MTKEDDDLTIAYMAGYQQAKDDFKSRTCENCKYFIDSFVGNVPVKDCETMLVNYPPKDFGCLKFERKDK